MVPLPWHLFRRAVARTAEKTARRLGDLDPVERRVHRFVVRELPRLGRPMPPEHVAGALELSLDQVVAILDRLERRLVYLFRPDGRDVVWAYPNTVEPTAHRMATASGERLYAA